MFKPEPKRNGFMCPAIWCSPRWRVEAAVYAPHERKDIHNRAICVALGHGPAKKVQQVVHRSRLDGNCIDRAWLASDNHQAAFLPAQLNEFVPLCAMLRELHRG